jgi:3-methyladenine DNA glycosylase AlkD
MKNHDSVASIVERLKRMGDPRNAEGMARFGINPAGTLGVPMRKLRPLAKANKGSHELALGLWGTGFHEARILAALVDDPALVTERQMELWVSDVDSWDVCDACCLHLFGDSPLAWKKAVEWSKREEEYVKRAGYALMAVLAVHDKATPDAKFLGLLPHIVRGAKDERNYVRKAVNWALRQIGKRNSALNRAAIAAAKEVLALDTKAARWIARDALRELKDERVRARLDSRAHHECLKSSFKARRT